MQKNDGVFMGVEEKKLRIGHDDFVFRFRQASAPPCGCLGIDAGTMEVLLNGKQMQLDEGKKRKVSMLCERLFSIKGEYTYGKMREAGVKTAVLLKDLADAMEKYYKVQLGLVLNPESSAGEMETRTFEDLVRDIVSELAYMKKEVAESAGRDA